MTNTVSILKNDRGSTIIVAVLILVFLTIIGISAINTSTFEMQIVGNEHRYQIDFYVADKVLWDYKVTTMYVLIDGVKPEWEAQGNINAYLLGENSFNVNHIKICCIFRDWSKIQALKNPNYMSRKQVAVLNAKALTTLHAP